MIGPIPINQRLSCLKPIYNIFSGRSYKTFSFVIDKIYHDYVMLLASTLNIGLESNYMHLTLTVDYYKNYKLQVFITMVLA
jgi:hypothetical protein